MTYLLLEFDALLSHDELKRIPVRYRLLIKMLLQLPNPRLPFFVLKHFPELEGILWAMIAPLFLVLYFLFSLWLFSFATIHFGFPLNYVFGFSISATIFVFFLRIQLERTIIWWKNIQKEPKEWQTAKRVKELVEILNKQQTRKKS